MDVSVPAVTLAAPSRVVAAARWLASLRHLSLLAVLAWTAHAHWSLATLLHVPVWLAWALPIAVDAYVLSALRAWEASPQRRHADLWWALGLDAAAVSGAHAATQLVLPQWVLATVAAVLGVVLVLVLWRVHALDVEVRQRTSRPGRQPAVAPAAPVVGATARPAPQRRAVASATSGKAKRDAWVAEQRAAGRQRGDVVSEAAERFGCGRRSAERSWDGVAA